MSVAARRAGFVQVSAHAAALAMLDARYGVQDVSQQPSTAGLAEFQQHAVGRLCAILDRRRGAILGDSVGLGKSHIAAAIISTALEQDQRVLVCGPASLAPHWRRVLRGKRRWQWLSHSSLSRRFPATGTGADGLVVIDEAHALRNPATRRYHHAALLAPRARLLLLTATPVNNSVFDFYHLVRLFARDDDFVDIGVPDLLGATHAAATGQDRSPLRRVAEHVMVRRSRDQVVREYGHLLATPGSEPLRFPSRSPVQAVHYDSLASWPAFERCLRPALESLTFPAHRVANGSVAAELMRLALLKRLESGCAAFTASVARHIDLLEQFISAARDGFLLRACDYRFVAARHPGEPGEIRGGQLALNPLLLRPWPPQLSAPEWIEQAEHDRDALQLLLRSYPGHTDPKLTRVRALLETELCDEQVLIFTEYRDTARALWKALASSGGVAMITGHEARLGRVRSSRRAVIERFAPRSNGVRSPRSREHVRVLIATDVLSEGLNLQDARAVISYDVPWNPVRMAQRIGRIDRLGSPHATVLAYAVLPDSGLDRLLGLMRRVRRKIRAIATVGGDAPMLAAHATGSRSRAAVPPPGSPPRASDSSARQSIKRTAADWDRIWSTAETLRAIHRRVRLQTRPGPPATGDATVLGTMSWADTQPAALCCVAGGGVAPVLVLVRHGVRRGVRRASVHPDQADDLLLRALSDSADSGPAIAPELAAWLVAAGRRAVAAARAVCTPAPFAAQTRSDRGFAPAEPPRSGEPVERMRQPTRTIRDRAGHHARVAARAAACVRRWLHCGPGDPSPADCERADRMLRALAAPLHSVTERRLAQAIRRGATLDKNVERLASVLDRKPPPPNAGHPRDEAPHVPGPRRRLRLVAVLVLLPRPDEGQEFAA